MYGGQDVRNKIYNCIKKEEQQCVVTQGKIVYENDVGV
jgi:hypothetical protein